MINENKISSFILELIKKTYQDKIKWNPRNPNEINVELEDNILDLVYETRISNNFFRLFKYKKKYYRDEYDWEWVQNIKFEMIDDRENSLYEFPYNYSIVDLYDTVREKTSNISEILDSFLDTEV